MDDQNFSNYVGGSTWRSGDIEMTGYNYDLLYRYCEDLVERLSSNPRVSDLSIEGNTSSMVTREYLISYDHDRMSLYGISPYSTFGTLSERLFSNPAGSYVDDDGTLMEVRIVSDDADNFDVWHLQNEYIRIDSTDIRFAR